jgi:hypothetical protein
LSDSTDRFGVQFFAASNLEIAAWFLTPPILFRLALYRWRILKVGSSTDIVIASVGSLPALRTYKCEECGVRRTETGEARETSISSLKSNLYLVEPAASG